jgi:hypothetical protein
MDIMNLVEFRESLSGSRPPSGIDELLRALLHEACGDWERAHAIVQGHKSRRAAAVHAYLHRREGDLANADYWYERAGRERPRGRLEKEWDALAAELLDARRE